MNAGRCDACQHQRLIQSGKGSTFSLCERSKIDPAYPRYPRLPVHHCAGFEPSQKPATAKPEADR